MALPYLTDDDITATPERAEVVRPDYIGVVSGAQYKLEGADGVTEYALVVILDTPDAILFEMSEEDLRYLSRQINGLINQ